MRITSILIGLLLVTAFSTAGHAQSRFRVEVLGGASFNSLSPGMMEYWDDGWRGGGALVYRLSEGLDVALNLAYDRYAYRNGAVKRDLPPTAYKVTGEPSNAQEVSLGIRASSPAGVVGPFMAVSAGLFNLNTGKITVQEFDSNGEPLYRFTYRDSGVSNADVFASLAFGLIVKVNSRIGVLVEGAFNQSFASNRTVMPLVVRVQYAL